MKKLFLILLVSSAIAAQAQPAHLVISQIYGSGGNTGALYRYDYIELYNPTASAISLAGWSLQYSGATGKTWNSNKANLSGSVAPGKYFLVQCGNPGTEGVLLPTPDFIAADITISTSSGKVALVSNTTVFTVNCPLPNAAIVDFVGFGTADCAETAAATGPVTSNTTSSITRLNSGCTDADNNSADFVLATASPRNSTSNGHTCNSTSISVGAVMQNPFCVDAATGAAGTVSYTATGAFSNSTFKAVLSDAAGSFGFSTVIGSALVSGTNPSGTLNITIPAGTASATAYRIRIEAANPPLLSTNQSSAIEVINGAKNIIPNEFSSAANNTTMTLNWINPSGCFDEILIVAKEGSSVSGTPSGDGSAYMADLNFAGAGTPFGGGKVVYKGTTSGQTVTNLTNGVTYFFKAYTRRGSYWSSGTEISDKPRVVPLPGEIVINQFSPQYTTKASDEYVELVNLTAKPFDLSDVAIRHADATGTNGVAGGTLSGILQPYSFWLLTTNDPTTVTVGQTTSLARDTKINDGFTASNNQIGLVRKTDNTLLDAIGYGTISNGVYTEGAAAVNPTSRGGLKRKVSGADNNNNNADFMGVANADIDLRNSSSRLANTGAVIPAGDSYTTLEVTGNASLSGQATFSGKVVLTNGVFTLNSNTLTTAKATEGTGTKYIKTNGTGALIITNVGTSALFPVGNSTYNPVTISNGSGLTWRVHVADTLAPNPAFNRQYAVQRTWNVTPSATPATGATVVFEYNDNDPAQVGPYFDKTKPVQVWSNHNGLWQAITEAQTPATTASGRKAVTLPSYSQFSPFVIVNVNAPLPVRFTQFSARQQSGGVQLQFTNASESDVAHYAVERSTDGQLFQTLIQLVPQHNNGSQATYRWMDATPPAGAIWYRIKGVDADGTTRLTPVLKLNKDHTTKGVTLYPNPVQGESVVWQATLPSGTYDIQVRNSTGQVVLEQQFTHSGGNRAETLTLPALLPPGVYYLQIGNGMVIQRQSFVVLW